MSEETFPDRLRIRDTQLHDDMGGAGQRIYTTAGQGYTKVEYVRADLHDALRAEVERLQKNEDHLRKTAGGWFDRAHERRLEADELRSQLSARDAEVRALRGFAQEVSGIVLVKPSALWGYDVVGMLFRHALIDIEHKPTPLLTGEPAGGHADGT